MTEEIKEAGLWKAEYENEKKEWFLETVDLIRARYHTLKDFGQLGRPYFSEEYPLEEKALNKNLKKEPRLKEWLPELADRLEAQDPFTLESSESVVRNFVEEKEVKAGLIINAIRAAVTGQLAGPGLFDILVTLGKDSTARRLRKVVRLL